ncbi:DUF4826 family protein [Arsukibacterium sp.]|uniref:DUF4826 family protein n=1 Tax=Arsukibacterium sp. TaxID=1977258 RepID=UPI002FD8A58A
MSEQLTQAETEFTEEQRVEWIRTQFQKANEYLATKGILPDNVAVSESRYLPPLVALWKLNTKAREAFWVISGDLPTDHMAYSGAADAREAMRSFSLRWQLKAEQIVNAGITDKTQQDFADLLVARAQGLYELFDNEQLWQPAE